MITLKRMLLLVAVLGLAACDQANIVTPTNNSVSIDKPVTFQIAFTGSAAPTDLAIQLNTADVTDLFTVTDVNASADGALLADHVFSGRNIFRVKAYNQIKQVAFYYDTEGPEIHILDANRETMTVTGYVSDPGGVESLILDGVAVELGENNSFSTAFMDQPFNTFEALDGFGHSSTTEIARGDNEFNGIAARLNQGGLDFLVNVLEGELAKADFQEIVDNIGTIELLNAGIFDLNLTVTSLNLDNIDIGLDVQDDEKIDTSLYTQNFELGVSLSGRVWILFIPVDWSSGATIQMDELYVGTDLLLDILNSDLDIALSSTTVDHSAIKIDLHNTPNILNFIDMLTSAVVNVVAPLFEDLFINILEKIIIPIVSDFIKDIPITLQLVTLDDGEELMIRALPTYLDSFGNGISVDLGTRIWAPNPPAGIPGSLGSLYVEGETPSLGSTTPDGTPFHFGASISSNVINQALHAAHEAGVTTMDISPGFYANATPAGIAVYTPADADIQEGDQIGMRIEPASAPYIKLMPADGAAGVFAWYDVKLTFDLYKAEWGEYRTLFGVTFNLEVPFEVNSTEDGFLSIGIEQLPTLFITKTDTTGMIVLPPGFINSTLDFFMPAVMPRLAEELKVVPLPRIYEHTLLMRDFWIAGSGNNNLSLAGDLIPVSVTEAAAAPETQVQDVVTEDVTVKVESVSDSGVVTSKAVTVNNGEVTIDIDGLNPNPDLGLLEYRYRVDGGGWSIWKRRDEIHLTRLLAGDHSVEVCSRTPLLKRELSCPVVEFTTTVAQ